MLREGQPCTVTGWGEGRKTRQKTHTGNSCKVEQLNKTHLVWRDNFPTQESWLSELLGTPWIIRWTIAIGVGGHKGKKLNAVNHTMKITIKKYHFIAYCGKRRWHSLPFTIKREFFLAVVTKWSLIRGCLIVGVFSLLLKGPHNIKNIEGTVVIWRCIRKENGSENIHLELNISRIFPLWKNRTL